ncbi:MAG: 2-dehydropantoate 2-reductase [Planctomycetes bacterium]|nr:2-dehydropantoate 2-reductase [Planctomycetota bacterium]
MDYSRETIGVIGTGPVGAILGSFLVKAGKQVAFVDLPHRIQQIRENGINISRFMEMQVKPDALVTDIRDLAKFNMSMIFIATKTPSLKSIVPRIKEIYYPGIRVISFQNGIGVEDFLSETLGAQHVSRGVVNFAGNINPDTGNITMNWFHPPNFLGPANERANDLTDIAEVLTAAGLATKAISHREMKRQAFFKTILNSALNAMCASTGITMSKAMRYRHTRSLAKTLIREGLGTAAMLGYYYGENTFKQCMDYLDSGGDHYPSMWTDLERKLPTEIEYINGAIVRIAIQFKDLDVDLNKFFVSMIVTEEIKNGSRDPDDIPEYLT